MTTLAKPAVRPANPHFSSGPCAKIPGWTPDLLANALDRPLASLERRQGAAQAGDRPHARSARSSRQPSDRHRAGLRYGRRRDGAVVAARAARAVDLLAWESFGEGWVSDVVKQLKLKDARIIKAAYGELPDLATVDFSHDVVFTWNGTTSGVRVPDARLDPGRPPRPHHLRCDLGRLRAGARFRQARCRDLLLAEGAGRRGRAWRDHPVAARRRAARKLYAALAAAEDLPHDARRQAHRTASSTGETINTPSMLCVEDYIVALELGEEHRRPQGAARARRRQCRGHRPLDRRSAPSRITSRRTRDALQHIGVPHPRWRRAACRRRW